MNQIQLKFAELHTPLFLAGKNFGTKLDPGKHGGLKLEYNRDEKELLVTWGKDVGIVPSGNIAAMIPGMPVEPKAQSHHPIVAGIASAQVSTPMGHVQAGPGFGKTGKDK